MEGTPHLPSYENKQKSSLTTSRESSTEKMSSPDTDLSTYGAWQDSSDLIDGSPVGDFYECYLVKEGNQQSAWEPAKIIAQKYDQRPQIPSGTIKYYVHYVHYDRRLDQWLDSSHIDWENKITENDPVLRNVPDSKRTRNQKRKFNETNYIPASWDPMDTQSKQIEKLHQDNTLLKHIQNVYLGDWKIKVWYFSPYPGMYRKCEKLFICQFCMNYMMCVESMLAHRGDCKASCQPPGLVIYRKDQLAVYEVDGKNHKIFCQNLCLFAKLFIDHKTLFYDVDSFYFYILTKVTEKGEIMQGYFSKEKICQDNNNLACLLVFPPFQRHGYGRFLISFSYEIAKMERLVGGPERPLSDLATPSYHGYWSYEVRKYLLNHPDTTYIKEVVESTCIAAHDVAWAIQHLRLGVYQAKGQEEIDCSQAKMDNSITNVNVKIPRICVDNRHIRWQPRIKTATTWKKKRNVNQAGK